MKTLLLFVFILFISVTCFAQQIERFNPDTVKTLEFDLEPVKITTGKFGIETFISAILADTSFYKAFKNMRKYSFTAENSIYTYDKNNKVDSKMYTRIFHNNDGPYKQQVLAKQATGKIYRKNGKYDLKTVEMFDYIFMNPYNSDFTSSNVPKSGADESYKDQLKTLIFRPGHKLTGKVGFVIGGSKTELFSSNMRQYYDYSYSKGTYLDSIPVYRFKVLMKPGLSNWTKDGIMIKEMNTIFDQRTMQILGRYIDMKLDNMLYDFDVQMNIELGYFGQDSALLPTKISYQGNWDYVLKSQERASFLILHKGYKPGRK